VIHWDCLAVNLAGLATAAAAAGHARRARGEARTLRADFDRFRGLCGLRLLKLDALLKDVAETLDRIPGLDGAPVGAEEFRSVVLGFPARDDAAEVEAN
jgi:hypothetical protein